MMVQPPVPGREGSRPDPPGLSERPPGGGRIPPSIRRVLVATDLSPAGDAAVLQAASLAARHGAELHLLAAVEEGRGRARRGRRDPREAARRLDRRLGLNGHGRDADAGSPRVVAVRTGRNPAASIVDYGTREQIDLTVVPQHHRWSGRWHLLESPAEEVLSNADNAVLTVPPDVPAGGGPGSILVACDFSDGAWEALCYGWRIARLEGAPLLLVPDPDRPEDEGREAGVEMLERCRESMGPPSGPVGVRCCGRPVLRSLVEMADSGSVRLLVVASHGAMDGPDRLIGRLASGLVRQAACPVLTVRVARGAPPTPFEHRGGLRTPEREPMRVVPRNGRSVPRR